MKRGKEEKRANEKNGIGNMILKNQKKSKCINRTTPV